MFGFKKTKKNGEKKNLETLNLVKDPILMCEDPYYLGLPGFDVYNVMCKFLIVSISC